MDNQNILDIKSIIRSRKYKTNCFAFYDEIITWIENKKANAYIINKCVFIFYQANGFYKFYYYVRDFNEIQLAKKLLDKYNTIAKVSLEFTTKNDKFINEVTDAILTIGFSFYAEFARLVGGSNITKDKDKDKDKDYELATLEDKKELLEIMHQEFDVVTDNIPTDEELTYLIETKCIALKHIDNKIVYIQIYEYSKGALYSRMTWIAKKYRKPKYTIDIYNEIDAYIDSLNIEKTTNLRSYYWINTGIKNYKIAMLQGGVLEGLKCITFIYSSNENN